MRHVPLLDLQRYRVGRLRCRAAPLLCESIGLKGILRIDLEDGLEIIAVTGKLSFPWNALAFELEQCEVEIPELIKRSRITVFLSYEVLADAAQPGLVYHTASRIGKKLCLQRLPDCIRWGCRPQALR